MAGVFGTSADGFAALVLIVFHELVDGFDAAFEDFAALMSSVFDASIDDLMLIRRLTI